MHSDIGNGSRAARAWGFMALFAIMLAMGLGSMATPAEAAPFAYVTNSNDATVSVIDTATTPPSVVATVTLQVAPGIFPIGVAVTPDGKHAYVTVFAEGVLVIDTARNTVAGTIPMRFAQGVAVTPDGAHAYVTINSSTVTDTVQVIDTATNTVVGTGIPGGGWTRGDRDYPGRETRLCHASEVRRYFGDRHGDKYRGGYAHGGV